MHRTQISLEKEQYELLTREARRRGVSLAALLRELVRARYPRRKSSARSQVEALEKMTALGAGSGDAVGRKHNQFLYDRKRA
jgi:ribbon-helix-helix CopG family protein